MHKSPQEQTTDEWLESYGSHNVTPIQSSALVVPPRDNPLPDESGEGLVIEYAWVPAGIFRGTYLKHELKPNFRGYGDKLIVEFCIVDGDYIGDIVRGFFNVTITGENKFSVRGGSRWVTEIRQLFPERNRKDRLPVSLLKNRVIEIQVRDSRGKKQKDLPENERYSVVKKMLRLVE